MNAKVAARDNVRLQAEDYYREQESTERQFKRLLRAIHDAAAVDLTQQEIADACVAVFDEHGDDERVHRLSRQRIQQLLKESPE